MAKNPSSVWYWNDWVLDPAVGKCSLAAQGFWMRMLAICAGDNGYIRETSFKDLAKVTRIDVRTVRRLVAELEANEVFSRQEDGTIFCRRMVREKTGRANTAKKAPP